MINRRRMLAGLAATAAVTLSLSACGGGRAGVAGNDDAEAGSNAGALIGVAMPTKTSERWIDDGDNVKAKLEALGYKVDVQYANNKVPDQQQQIESMLNNGAKALIIASIDGTALTTQLADAGADGVKVIAYDRLINGSPNVDYYVTFDNEKVGIQQGTSLLTGLGILDAEGNETDEKGPFNIELFAGSPDDNNATFFYDGAMSVLQPYIDKGTLVVALGPDRVPAGRHPAVGAGHRPGPDGDHPQRVLLRQGARRRAVALRRSLPRHPERHQGRGHRQPDRDRPGRREAL